MTHLNLVNGPSKGLNGSDPVLNGQGSSSNRSPFQPKIVSRRSEAELAYEAALNLVAQIEEHLTYGTRHYRTKDGTLLHTLDQVVLAILTDNLWLHEADLDEQQDLRWAA